MGIDPLLLTQHQANWWNAIGNGNNSATSFWDESSTNGTGGSIASQFDLLESRFTSLKNEIANNVAATQLEDNAAQKTEEFAEELRAALEEAGIDIGDGVTLTLDDETGAVRVMGDHESKEAIEEFFSESEEWSEKYADVHLRNDLVRQLQAAQSSSTNSSNPYVKNKVAWETVTINITPDGYTVGSA